MLQRLSRLTTNQRLALLAFVLGAAAVGATPTRQGRVTLNPQELGLIVQREADHVTVQALADDLAKGLARFRVIDVRSDAAFAAYHLPTAENVSIGALATAELPGNERILLYGDDGVHAAQAWFLLKAQGYPGVYMLRGGMAEWKDAILHPVIGEAKTPEQRRQDEQRAALATFFGGAPRAAVAGAAVPPVAASAVAAATPAPSAAAPQMPARTAKAKAPKKREGC